MGFDLGNFLKKKWDTSVVRDAVSSNTAADQQRRQVAATKTTNNDEAVRQVGRELSKQQREGKITGQEFSDKFGQLLAGTTKDAGYKNPYAQAGNFAKSIVKPFWETGDTVVKGAQLGVANVTGNQQAADKARQQRDQSYAESVARPVSRAASGINSTFNPAQRSADKQLENRLTELRDNTETFTQSKAKEIQDGIRAGVYDPQKGQEAIQQLLSVNEGVNSNLGQYYDEKLAKVGLTKDMSAAQSYAQIAGDQLSTAGLVISPASGATLRSGGGNVVSRGLSELGTNSTLNALGGASSAYGQGANLEESLKAGVTNAGVGALMMGAGYLKGLKGPAAVETNIPAAPNSLREQIQVAKNNVRLTINNPDEANVFKVNNPLDAKTTGLDINNPMGAQTKPLDVRNPLGAETGKKLSIIDRYKQATDINAPKQDGFVRNPLAGSDAPQVGKTDIREARSIAQRAYKDAEALKAKYQNKPKSQAKLTDAEKKVVDKQYNNLVKTYSDYYKENGGFETGTGFLKLTDEKGVDLYNEATQTTKSPLTPNNQRTIDSYGTPKPITEYKVGEKVSVATAQGGEVNGTITKTPDFAKDLRIKGNDFSVKLEDGTIRKTDGAGFGESKSPLTVEKNTARFDDVAHAKSNEQKLIQDYKKNYPGKMLNTDDVRESFKDVGYNRKNAADYHEGASHISNLLFDEQISTLKPGDKYLFMAGSSGAGKSHTLATHPQIEAGITAGLDGNFSSASAMKKLDRVIATGAKPTISFVERDPLAAWQDGVMKRTIDPKNGRVVPLDVFIDNYFGARSTVLEAAKKYGDKIELSAFKDNVPIDDPIAYLSQKGYNKSDVIRQNLQSIEDARAAGKIDEATASALAGKYSSQRANLRRSNQEPQLQSPNLAKKPLSQPVDEIPAIAKRVSEPQQRGFAKSVQEAPNVDPATKKLVDSEYKPKENDTLMGEAKALLSEGASIDFKNTKNLDQKVAATIQEAVNAQARGDHAGAAALYNNLAEHGTELGRGVQAFALLENMSPEAVSLSVAGRIKKYNATHRRQIPELNGAQQKQISEKIIAADLLKGREKNIALNELDNLVSSYIPSSFADKAITVWKAGLLTSFRTHERNFIGNAVHGVAETVKDVPASAADMLMSGKTGKRTVTSTIGGIKEGLGAFGSKSTRQQIKDIVSKGYDPSEQINKFDYKKITWGNNLVEKGLKGYTEAVFRTLGASDKPFYNSALARSLHNSAAVEAINLGKRGNKAFIENLVKNPTEQMMKDAISDANVATFKNRNQATNVVNNLKRAMNQTEYGKVAAEITMPFTGVPTSILGEIINYSPIGLVKGAAKVGAVTAGKVPDLQRQAAQELGKGVVGSAIFGLGSYLMGQGIMTGQPKDAAEAKQWEIENKPRNSIFIAGKWRSLNSLGPEAVVFLAGAKAQEAKSNPEGSIAEYGLNLGKDYLDQSFVKGLQSPVNALTDPKRYGKSYLGQTASSVVPNFVKDIARATNPTQRETNTVGDYVKNSLPGLNKTLLPRRDSLGNPMAQEPTGVNALVDLFNSKTPVKSSVIDEMKRLKAQDQDVMPPIIDKKIKIDGTDVQLTDAQRNSLRGSIGKTIQDAWNATIKTPEYQALAPEKQSQALDNIASDVRASELRKFAAQNKLGQWSSNFTGKAGELTANQSNLVNNKFDSTAYTTKNASGKTKAQSDYDVASSNRNLTMTRAKASNDLNTWIKAAGEEYNAIGEQIKALDPKTDQVKINTLIKKQEALQRTANGYTANGYIKKTAKATGKGSKGGKFTIPTTSVSDSARTSTFTNLNRLLAGTTKTNSNKGKIGNKVALRKITVKGAKS